MKEALFILRQYAGKNMEVYNLAGDSRAKVRQQVMSLLLGRKAKRAESGVTAIRAEFYRLAEVTGDCGAERSENFTVWANRQLES